MNIFYLERDPKIAAEFHCDKHVVKMIVESAQMLSSAHWMTDFFKYNLSFEDFKTQHAAFVEYSKRDKEKFNIDIELSDKKYRSNFDAIKIYGLENKIDLPLRYHCYRFTHVKHPSAIWAYESKVQYKWLSDLALNLCYEYTKRYKRIHSTQKLLETLSSNVPDIPLETFRDPPLCMPEEYYHDDHVLAYRMFYKGKKSKFAKWKYTKQPYWWDIISHKQ